MHLSPEALAGYLDADLPGEEQGPVELHLASCAECREELAELRRLQRRRRRPWMLVLAPTVAAAAVLLIVALPRQVPAPSDLRAAGPAEPPLEIVSPFPSAQVAPGLVTFTWRSAGPDASYRFILQEAGGHVAWSSTTTDTVAVVPVTVADTQGQTWFWMVDALLPDGRSRSTGINRLRTGT